MSALRVPGRAMTVRRHPVLPGPPEWTELAACAGSGSPDLWFPAPGEDTAAAMAVCRSCPARVRCLGYVLDDPSIKGIWAGFTERTRRRVVIQRVAGRSLEDIIAASDAAADARHDTGLARAAGETFTERKRTRERKRRAAVREARIGPEAAA